MTNDELKKKIVDTIMQIKGYSVLQAEQIANALIAAGIGDVETLRKIGVSATTKAVLEAAKAEHRAEVAERALELMARGECTFASPEYYKKQAKKELSEERKDD